jgi:hypothetical protein
MDNPEWGYVRRPRNSKFVTAAIDKTWRCENAIKAETSYAMEFASQRATTVKGQQPKRSKAFGGPLEGWSSSRDGTAGEGGRTERS